MQMTDDDLLTVQEVAGITGLSVGTLRHWVSQGRIPFVRFSARCVRFRRSDIETWIAEKVVAPTSTRFIGNRFMGGKKDSYQE
jgi:excisionase family DNA binding protein